MNPDSPETRISRLEQKVARLEQRVEDLLVTVATQVSDLDRDIRAFAPLTKDVNDLQHELGAALTEARGARQELRDLRVQLEERENDRRKAEERRAEVAEAREIERRKERKAERKFLVTTLLGVAMLIVAAIQVLSGVG